MRAHLDVASFTNCCNIFFISYDRLSHIQTLIFSLLNSSQLASSQQPQRGDADVFNFLIFGNETQELRRFETLKLIDQLKESETESLI